MPTPPTVASSIATALGTAAATLSAPVVPIVRAGEPSQADLGDVPTFAYWYMGTKTWEAHTLSRTQELSCWHIRLYYPLKPRIAVTTDVNVEQWLETATGAVRGVIYGDVSLNGASTGRGFEIDMQATAGWIFESSYRVVDMELEVFMAAPHTIA